MKERQIEGAGIFRNRNGYWESEPALTAGGRIELDSDVISPSKEERVKSICFNWNSLMATCFDFIESQREEYGLLAKRFESPNVIITDDDWIVFFSTEHEFESSVGVEFQGDTPFQLVIGD
jgi:hypothetical protein